MLALAAARCGIDLMALRRLSPLLPSALLYVVGVPVGSGVWMRTDSASIHPDSHGHAPQTRGRKVGGRPT